MPPELEALEVLTTSPGAYAFAVLMGLLWGSFANVCIYRWPPTDEFPKGRSVVAPGSHCFACKTPIRWYDNVPMVSWLWLRGQCRTCHAPFSARYLIVEAVTGVLFGVAWYATVDLGALFEAFDARLIRFAVYAAFAFVMVVVSFIDLDHKLILDKVTLPSIAIFYGLGLVVGRAWAPGLVGALLGYLLPWTIGEIYWLVTGREGLGLGDSKLLAVVGALLGVPGVVASLFGGAMVGSVIGVIVLLRAPRGEAAAGEAPTAAAAAGGLAATLLAVGAVVATVGATVAALMGLYVVAGAGCVVALGALVLSRRGQDLAPEAGEVVAPEDAADADVDAPAGPPAGRLAIGRALAVVGGACVLLGVMAALVREDLVATAAGVIGAGLLLAARRVVGVVFVDEAASASVPDAPAPDAPSLLRTELPFGPFLAAAAVVFLFAEPWLSVHLRIPGH